MADRVANDRSVKSIKFLQAYARLCEKFDRHLEARHGELCVVRFSPTPEDLEAARLAHATIIESD